MFLFAHMLFADISSDVWKAIIGAAGAAIGVLAAKLFDYFKARGGQQVELAKIENEGDQASDEQAFSVFKHLLKTMEARLDNCEKKLEHVTEQESQCRAEMARKTEQMASLRREVDDKTEQIAALRKEVGDLRIQVAKMPAVAAVAAESAVRDAANASESGGASAG